MNGKLFAETLRAASFTRAMRETLLDCTALDWSRISPAIFGSLFQSIMDVRARRDLGAHYTRETNIRKALAPLFLDGLRAEFEKISGAAGNARRLVEFHEKLAAIHVLDPACGCGNFLDVGSILRVDVDQFYGIEIEEFPAQIAQVALWLVDHQMNMKVSDEFGQYFVRLPLRKAASIVNGNALALDWASLVDPAGLTYIVGNPPFLGKKEQSAAQKAEVLATFAGVKGAGVLDYVACWYRRAVGLMARNPAIRTAFVSTNSITQGEQVGILFPELFRHRVRIHFAHRTFQWSSEARGKAAVHCVIIGFALHDASDKMIYEYETPDGEPHAIRVGNINPYLVEGDDVTLRNRRQSVSATAPEVCYGSFAFDDGHLTLSAADVDALLAEAPESRQWLRPFIGGQELIHGERRWCLWLKGANPGEIRACIPVLRRVEAVRTWRQASKREMTKKLAATPSLFAEIRQPEQGNYLAFPTLSSEKRTIIPVAFLNAEAIASNQVYIVPAASLYDFGVLTSLMHMAWVRAVCGRLESRYRYSAGIVYNNFPWPQPGEAQRGKIEAAAQTVLAARALYPSSALADLYDPLTMPPELSRAHKVLDRAVDAAYGKTSFATEAGRVAFLFRLYQRLAG